VVRTDRPGRFHADDRRENLKIRPRRKRSATADRTRVSVQLQERRC
jgi:hypothetical protein